MPKVNTFDSAFDASKTADDHATDVAGLGLAIREAWARLLEASASDPAVEATPEADQSQGADDGPAVFATYYDSAHERVSAAEPVVSFKKLAP